MLAWLTNFFGFEDEDHQETEARKLALFFRCRAGTSSVLLARQRENSWEFRPFVSWWSSTSNPKKFLSHASIEFCLMLRQAETRARLAQNCVEPLAAMGPVCVKTPVIV